MKLGKQVAKTCDGFSRLTALARDPTESRRQSWWPSGSTLASFRAAQAQAGRSLMEDTLP